MVKFEDSMNISKEFREKNQSENWNFLKSIYEDSLNTDTKTKIPKKIHQIWIGKEIPQELKNFSDIWSQMCQENGWEYYLWDNHNIQNFVNDLFFTTENYGQKSDILRYNILKKIGGIYVDMDFVPIKMFDDLILKNEFFCGIAYESNPILYNGLIGSIIDGDIISDLCNIESVKFSNHQEIMETTGPYYLTNKFMNHKKGGVAFPLTFFYPFSNRDFDRVYGNDYKNYIKDETYCVHLWKCSWM